MEGLIKSHIILVDLPVFPKGTVTLSLPAVAAVFGENFRVKIFDLNKKTIEQLLTYIASQTHIAFLGIKVSSQSVTSARELSATTKKKYPHIPVVWGGELPTLLPDECLKYADSIVQSLWEPVAADFISDLQTGRLKKIYKGDNKFELNSLLPPRFDLLEEEQMSNSFMGLPLETSRGCTEVCTFCMVHVMQKKNYFTKSAEQLHTELKAYAGKFINIVDYNFGVNTEHVVNTSKLIKESGALGWMAEMCIELLDNDEMLAAMKDSNCKMIYCGLESIETKALQSVHKMNTNQIENYERIIRKAQSHGIQIASGFILGIEGMSNETFENAFQFFQRMGIIYAKLTFLTYNPGTKVSMYMEKKGMFTTSDISYYDGNHLSYLPNGMQQEVVISGTENFIRKFYSLRGIVVRSLRTNLTVLGKLEFILFNICYREAYQLWLKHDILKHPENFSVLLNQPFRRSGLALLAEKLLLLVRKISA